MDKLSIQEGFPSLISLNDTLDTNEWKTLLPQNQSLFKELLLKHGALIFRDFPLKNAKDFSEFIQIIDLGQFVNYIGGDSPRNPIIDHIYTSTEAPADIYIPLHQELSYLNSFPSHIYFFCEIEPRFQGETIIADAREIYKALNPEVVARFQDKGLTFVSHYYHKNRFMEFINYFARSHKSWHEVFETDNKDEVEQLCQSLGITLKWLRGDWIEIKHSRPAVIKHPITKDLVWFNQAHLYDFNPKLLGLMRFLAVKLVYFRRLTRLHEVSFADGSPIPRSDLYHILDILDKNTVSNPWKQADVMVLDNILTMHGRANYKGNRKILTALTA